MNLILCLDDKGGLSFCGKRMSSDIEIYKRIANIIKDKALFMNEYSEQLFKNIECSIKVSENFLKIADVCDYCFAENSDFINYLNDIESIIVYRFNRVYPSSVKVTQSLYEGRKLVSSFEFAGNSHEKITEEIYI